MEIKATKKIKRGVAWVLLVDDTGEYVIARRTPGNNFYIRARHDSLESAWLDFHARPVEA